MKKIIIRYDPPHDDGLRWYRFPGYRWRCPHCGIGGRVAARHWPSGRRTFPSAFTRVMISVDSHLEKYHRRAHLAYVLRKST